MILPIIAYGDPVLRKVGVEISKDYPGLDQLIKDMFETMRASAGVGIAAPQVGKAIRLFLVDTTPFVNGKEMMMKKMNILLKSVSSWEISPRHSLILS